MTTEEKVKQIKRSFRLLMNGEASKYMRENGIDYHLNWGVAFSDLKQMAEEYGKDYHLAIQLWMENIRECKILATLIMPMEEMTTQLAELWMEQVQTLEMAEMLAHNLLQYLDFAPQLAFEWVATSQPLRQVCGYHIISGKLGKGPSQTSESLLKSSTRLPRPCTTSQSPSGTPHTTASTASQASATTMHRWWRRP